MTTPAKRYALTMALIAAGTTARIARADYASSDDSPPVHVKATADAGPPSQWLARLQAGLRWIAPSAEKRLLDQDGYGSSTEFVFSGDFAWYVLPAVGLGAWADYSFRGAVANAGGPMLRESLYAWGVEAPLRIARTSIGEVLVVPRFGYGWSFLDFGGHAEPVHAVAYGGDLSVLFPRAHLSFTVGYLNAPTGRPAAAGRDYNFGGVAVLLGGMIDG